MTYAEKLHDLLQGALQQAYTGVRVEAYHVCVDEMEQLGTNGERRTFHWHQLLLIWEDGSISRHAGTLPNCINALPLEQWRGMRYFDKLSRLFVHPRSEHAGLPSGVSIYDEEVAEWMKRTSLPPLSESFVFHLARQKRTVIHSKGLFRQESLTLVSAKPTDPRIPVYYSSRRMPTSDETTYLRAEAHWFGIQRRSLPPPSLSKAGNDIVVLFAPAAIRSLLQASGLFEAEYGGIERHGPLATEEFLATSPLRWFFHPLIPWAAGSFRLTATGAWTDMHNLHTLASFQRLRERLAEPIRMESIHWQSEKKRWFREWLAEQPNVLFIPSLKLPGSCSLSELTPAVVGQGFFFHYGRFYSSTSLTPYLIWGRLLSHALPVTIQKVGWDAPGVAICYDDLVKST